MNEAQGDILLSRFHPVSELVVPSHDVRRAKYPVIDFHTHLFPRDSLPPNALDDMVEKSREHNVQGFLNLIGRDGERFERCWEYVKPHGDRVISFGGVDFTRIEESDFASYVRETVKRQHNEYGIRGIKIFKSLGLVFKDSSGAYLRPDDKRIKPLWDVAAELDIPVLIHVADPVAFFKPIDGANERFEELAAHPDWSYYKPGVYGFNELIEMQCELIGSNPDTTFILAHVCSYSENLGRAGEMLDAFPNLYTDIGARLSDLGRTPYSARDFLIKHQDRVLFGVDGGVGSYVEYPTHFRCLETRDEYFPYSPAPSQGRYNIYGLDLPDEVLKKLYYKNAVKLVPQFAKIPEISRAI